MVWVRPKWGWCKTQCWKWWRGAWWGSTLDVHAWQKWRWPLSTRATRRIWPERPMVKKGYNNFLWCSGNAIFFELSQFFLGNWKRRGILLMSNWRNMCLRLHIVLAISLHDDMYLLQQKPTTDSWMQFCQDFCRWTQCCQLNKPFAVWWRDSSPPMWCISSRCAVDLNVKSEWQM